MSRFESINQPREDGFPKVKEIRATERFKTNPKELDYDAPYANLTKTY